jgi:hypothetical protein
MSLDRLVSMRDYEDFTRTFAGIGKATVAKLTDGRREFLHLTVAGADDIPIDTTSDLYRNLLTALRRFGDPDLPVQVEARELIALVLSANVKISSDYLWENVSDAIRAAVLEKFGFAGRSLGQPALRCEVIAVIQAIPGVIYADIDVFGGVPEKITDTDSGQKPFRRYRTPDELSLTVGRLLAPPKEDENSSRKLSSARRKIARFGVPADVARVDRTALIIPAQLAIFSPGVPDTLVLNEIS